MNTLSIRCLWYTSGRAKPKIKKLNHLDQQTAGALYNHVVWPQHYVGCKPNNKRESMGMCLHTFFFQRGLFYSSMFNVSTSGGPCQLYNWCRSVCHFSMTKLLDHNFSISPKSSLHLSGGLRLSNKYEELMMDALRVNAQNKPSLCSRHWATLCNE